MSREKVVNFPARASLELQKIVLWIITVGDWNEEKCCFLYKEELNGWEVTVHAKSFAKASKFVGECQKLLGMSDFSALEVQV